MLNLHHAIELLERQFPLHGLYPLSKIDSTSSYLKNIAKSSLKSSICITAEQTAGYGQRGKSWLSFDDSLTFSVLTHVKCPGSQLDGLSTLISFALLKSIAPYSVSALKLKWPNDLYSVHGKVAGLLIEVVAADASGCWLVIGVGINTGSTTPASLKDESYLADSINIDVIDMPEVLCRCVKTVFSTTDSFDSASLSRELACIQAVDYFKPNSDVIVYDNGNEMIGTYIGLTAKGEAMIRHGNTETTYRSGSASIRPRI